MTIEELAAAAAAADALPAVDWWAWRKCSQTCGAERGTACRSMSGHIVDGRPDGMAVELAVPHAARKPVRGRRGNMPRI